MKTSFLIENFEIYHFEGKRIKETPSYGKNILY